MAALNVALGAASAGAATASVAQPASRATPALRVGNDMEKGSFTRGTISLVSTQGRDLAPLFPPA